MLLLGRPVCRAVVGAIGTGAMAGAMLFGSAALAFAQPTPEPPAPPAVTPSPGCTAADLARVSGGVASATSDYLFSHPQVNDFFTSLHGLPYEEMRPQIQTYMDANPQVRAELNAIRQPVTDLRTRCQPPPPAQ